MTESFDTLVRRAQQGDEEAFEEIYRATYNRQLNYARLFIGDPFLAEDVLQDVYIKLYQNIKSIENPERFIGYLNRMTYNQCQQYHRKNSYKLETAVEQSFLDSFEDADSPEAAFLDAEKQKALEAGLKTLDPEELYILRVHYYENKKIQEIAKMTELSESTVKRRLRQAKDKMAVYLTEREMRGLMLAPASVLSAAKESAVLQVPKATKKPGPKWHHALWMSAAAVATTAILMAPAAIHTLSQPKNPPAATIATVTAAAPSSKTDTTPPVILGFTGGSEVLSFTLSDDTEIDYEQTYAQDDAGTHIAPSSIDPATGIITFPASEGTLTLYVYDKAGNGVSIPVTGE